MKKYRNNTSTRKNLESAISDEAISHVKYTLWGKRAKAEGYPEIAHCYEVAAKNELSHAEACMNELGLIGSIYENLQTSAEMVKEGIEQYISFAYDAENEGYDELKTMFLSASDAERNHMESFLSLHEKYISDEMFSSPLADTRWMCYNCGFVSEGETPPENCPLCGRPQTWFVKK